MLSVSIRGFGFEIDFVCGLGINVPEEESPFTVSQHGHDLKAKRQATLVDASLVQSVVRGATGALCPELNDFVRIGEVKLNIVVAATAAIVKLKPQICLAFLD